MAVIVLDINKSVLRPCSEKRARLLLERKRAVVDIIEPFTICILDRTLEDCNIQSNANGIGVDHARN
ncbi:MAG: hypothetical protein ACD_84C00018G0003 [uncultured bacterium]|nr:MAG: hypothetical protein ACD_84C00018G0003 [uncultured bacterium]